MKILIIRVGRVGDMLMITPAVRALVEAYPDAEFHMLTSADGQRAFKDFAPQLMTFLLHDRKKLLSKLDLKKQLKHVQASAYDSAFCFELNPSFEPFYKAAKDGGHCVDMSHTERHYARRCLDVVEGVVGTLRRDYWLNLPVTEAGKQSARQTLAQVGIDENTFVIGLHPTYSGMKKMAWRRNMDTGRRWPTTSFAELARRLGDYAEQHTINLRIIMDLMPDEAEVGEEIVQLSGGKVTMLVPPLDFQRYKATLARINILVTPDTGPMHIGGGVGTNLVALFGGTDPNDCGAYVSDEHYEIVQSPSDKIADITPEQVFHACKRFLPS